MKAGERSFVCDPTLYFSKKICHVLPVPVAQTSEASVARSPRFDESKEPGLLIKNIGST